MATSAPVTDRVTRPRTTKKRVPGIRAVIHAVQRVVAALHAGTISAPVINFEQTKPSTIRYTPSYTAGKPPTCHEAVAYTAASISRILDLTSYNDQASRWVRVALHILEGVEQGYVSEELLDNLGRPGYRVQPLLKELKFLRENYKLFN
jgi:hypothetical protein